LVLRAKIPPGRLIDIPQAIFQQRFVDFGIRDVVANKGAGRHSFIWLMPCENGFSLDIGRPGADIQEKKKIINRN
jgi:hypothetical protein